MIDVIPGRRSEAEASPESSNHTVWGYWIPGFSAGACHRAGQRPDPVGRAPE